MFTILTIFNRPERIDVGLLIALFVLYIIFHRIDKSRANFMKQFKAMRENNAELEDTVMKQRCELSQLREANARMSIELAKANDKIDVSVANG